VPVVASILTGLLFHYCKRIGGGLLWAIIAHFAWNFSVLSSYVSPNPAETAISSAYLSLVTAGLLIVVALARKRIEPLPAGG
jgi:hypothetical protein